MERVNCIIVIHPSKQKLLFCRRTGDPYKGLFNFVGGKIEIGETGQDAAYRELSEETGIGRGHIYLMPFMEYIWHIQRICMEVYVGTLKEDMPLREEKHPLYWLDLKRDFFDCSVFAGEGNIGHMVEILKMSELVNNRG